MIEIKVTVKRGDVYTTIVVPSMCIGKYKYILYKDIIHFVSEGYVELNILNRSDPGFIMDEILACYPTEIRDVLKIRVRETQGVLDERSTIE